MKNLKRLILFVVLFCVLPTALLAKPKPDRCRPGRRCEQMPEGGSAIVYLLGAGLTCIGAIIARTKSAQPSQR